MRTDLPLKTVTENIALMGRHPQDLISPLEQAMLDMMTSPIRSAAEVALQQSVGIGPRPAMSAAETVSENARRAALFDLDAMIAGR